MTMTTYALVKFFGRWVVQGLPNHWTGTPNTCLPVSFTEAATVTAADAKLLAALCALRDTCVDLNDGDQFTIDGKAVYRCVGEHIIPVEG
jgi:hypothetical protein